MKKKILLLLSFLTSSCYYNDDIYYNKETVEYFKNHEPEKYKKLQKAWGNETPYIDASYENRL